MTTRISCPLCAWRHEVPELDSRLSAATLAGVFGPGVMQTIAINQRMADIERALHAHLSTHTLVEWVQKVSRLTAELEALRATFPP